MVKKLNQPLIAALLVILSFPTLAGGAGNPTSSHSAPRAGKVQTGYASYYHDSLHGRKTASGKAYNKNKLSAAHKRLPLGTKVRVTNVRTGKSVVVRVNDRGPYVKGRIIDLSHRAAAEIGMLKKGVARVQVEVLSVPGRSGA